MKIPKSAMLPAILLGGVALYVLLKPKTASAAVVTAKPTTQSGIKIGAVTIPSGAVNQAVGTVVSSGVNFLTGLLTPSPTPQLPAATQVALATPTDPAALQSQIDSGFTGFGRYGLLVAASMPGRRY